MNLHEMSFQGFCPRCGTQIPRDRLTSTSVVCQCGWSDATSFAKAKQAQEKNVTAILVGAAVLMMLSYAHLANWGGYATRIPLIKAAQITGSLNKSGYIELAEACITLNKWDCAHDAYLTAYRNSGDPLTLAALAHLQTRLGDKQSALSTYATYYQVSSQLAPLTTKTTATGNSTANASEPMAVANPEEASKRSEALLRYAVLLDQSGRDDEAIQIYEASIAARTDVLPVRATSGIVRILMEKGRYEEAHARVTAFHNSAGNAKGYLNTELAQLESRLESRISTSSKSGLRELKNASKQRGHSAESGKAKATNIGRRIAKR
jgi:tetratricopeptide (TPR) repeat protein